MESWLQNARSSYRSLIFKCIIPCYSKTLTSTSITSTFTSFSTYATPPPSCFISNTIKFSFSEVGISANTSSTVTVNRSAWNAAIMDYRNLSIPCRMFGECSIAVRYSWTKRKRKARGRNIPGPLVVKRFLGSLAAQYKISQNTLLLLLRRILMLYASVSRHFKTYRKRSSANKIVNRD